MRPGVRLLTLLALAGCAHEQPKVEPAAPPVAVATPPPAPPAAKPAAAPEDSADLEAFLSQPLAHFEFDRAVLTPDDQLRLQVLAGLLRAQTEAKIGIAGNCDERGTEEYNLQLGARRAEVAKRYLVGLGVGADRIDTISYGEERPIDPGHDERAWAANRRDDGQVLVWTTRR
ncbi:MAG TPA: OmpA family protein [Myxococcaceae bacterium]|nr:OmpA family protein [Myxococcaceae bacterium]